MKGYWEIKIKSLKKDKKDCEAILKKDPQNKVFIDYLEYLKEQIKEIENKINK